MHRTHIRSLIGSCSEEGSSLLFSSKNDQHSWFKEIKQKSVYKPLLMEIEAEAQKLICEKDPELPFSLFKKYQETGSRLEYQDVYFARRRRLNTFTIMTLLEPENVEYYEALQNTLWSICDEYTWCLPAHLEHNPETNTSPERELSLQQQTIWEKRKYTIDLFAAETAFALSEILTLTEHLLDPLIVKRIKEEVYRRIFWPYHNDEFEWETATHNWASVCAGSIGSAAIYLMDDMDELAIILERVLRSMDYYLTGFNDDGACLEGYGYWQYGFGYYVYFADLVKKKTGGKINLFQAEKIHQIALFQQKSFLNKNIIVNFSDAVPKANVFLGLSHYLNSIYSDVEVPEEELRVKYTEDHCSRWAPAIRNLLWFNDEKKGKPWEEGSYYLSYAQWFISRYSSGGARYAFSAKGGHNDEPHNHNDIGHFMLYGNGELFLKDLGSGEYTSKSFGADRYSIFCNGSQGHSVPIINNQFQQEGELFLASQEELTTKEKYEQFKLNISQAYGLASLQKLLRTFTWGKHEKPRLTLKDSFAFFEAPCSIIERLITPILTIEEHADCIVLLGNQKQKLRILFDEKQLKLQLNKMQFHNHQGEKETFYVIDFIVKKLEKECTVKLVFQFE
ncbi:hypothetical protein CR203_13890 [Salipaludibacillus neizhouensis]|uniref:Heparinase n=1 Tax=Salipaludibacillus neizhouensis TaxID=885475 RepID=A0A3A9KQG3_9BACI|nr:heparinase II/III family protein [Salipaludibacillus neizhouensis]RKL66916.1 hypothetical protein CR203_13890 [Salipaludibacillus neizhouensis]